MPFDNPALPTTVRLYDVRSATNRTKPHTGPVMSPMEVVRHQLFLANRYKHLLIEAHLVGRKKFRDQRAELYPEYDALDQKVKLLKAEIDVVDKDIKRVKIKANRSGQKYVRPVELVAQKNKLLQEKQEKAAKLETMRLKINKDRRIGKCANKLRDPLLKAAKVWANNPTDEEGKPYKVALYQATERKAKEAIGQGVYKPGAADPEHKRWDGSGRLAVQLQHPQSVKDSYPATWTNIKAGHWSNYVQIREEERVGDGMPCHNPDQQKPPYKKPFTIFRIRIGSDEKKRPIFVDCPCVLDDWAWPEDAHCTWIYLTCRRVGRDYHYSLSFHLAREAGWAKEDQCPEGSVSVHPGYRKVEKGLRVATWVGDDDESGELIIPNTDITSYHEDFWRRETQRGVDYARKVNMLQKDRDGLFSGIKKTLKEYFDKQQPTWAAPIKEWLDKVFQVEKMLGKKTPDKQLGSKTDLLKLLREWRTQPWPAAVKEKIGTWHYKEVHLESWQTKQSAKWERHRLSRYRSFWAELRRRYHTIIITNIDWAELRRNPPPEESKNPAFAENRNIASPGKLVELAPQPVYMVDKTDITNTCHYCGYICDFDHGEILHTCENCGKWWDQDVNAAYNGLARVLTD